MFWYISFFQILNYRATVKTQTVKRKNPNPSFVDVYYNIGYCLGFFVRNTKIIISHQTALVKNDPNFCEHTLRCGTWYPEL